MLKIIANNLKRHFPWIPFLIAFFLTQIIAYGFDIKGLKVYVPTKDGSTYYLFSTLIPIILAFIIDFIYKKRKHHEQTLK